MDIWADFIFERGSHVIIAVITTRFNSIIDMLYMSAHISDSSKPEERRGKKKVLAQPYREKKNEKIIKKTSII